VRRLANPAVLVAAIWLGAASAAAQNAFEWTGQLAPGQRVEIQDVNGSIHAIAAHDGNIVVTAVKKPGRRGTPAEIRIETAANTDGVTVCVIYAGGSCDTGRTQANDSGHNDTTVNFTVQLPAGIGLTAHTTNGSVDVSGLQSDTDAATVNGSVTVATTGSVRATTVNGAIKATMGPAPNGGNFSTENGDVTLQLPSSINANVRVSTVNGKIKSDFPVQMNVGPGPKHAQGVIGAGGHELAISTVNGSVTLLRR
jgi:hypothetical protein